MKAQYLITIDLPRNTTRADLNGAVRDVLKQWCAGNTPTTIQNRPPGETILVQTILPEYKNGD